MAFSHPHTDACTLVATKSARVAQCAQYLACESVEVDNCDEYDRLDVRQAIHDIATSLGASHWLHQTKNNENMRAHWRTMQPTNMFSNKPLGTWCSKGDWLFHDMAVSWNKKMYLVDVDYTNVALLTSGEDVRRFTDTYMIKHVEFPAFGIDWVTFGIDWVSVSQDYDAFAVVPFIDMFHHDARKFRWLSGFDVSSLVVWNSRCVKRVIPVKFKPRSSDTTRSDVSALVHEIKTHSHK